MAYNDNLGKSQQEAIPELYTFAHGATVDRYTSYVRDLEFMGETYRAAPIKRSSFSKDAEFGTVAMSVTAPLIPSILICLKSYANRFLGSIKTKGAHSKWAPMFFW